MKSYEDYSGSRFGRWTVIEEAEPKMYNGRRLRMWKCVCDCGTIRNVKEQSLKSGKSKSCGCYHSDIMHEVGKVNTTHGQADTRLYRIYKHMIRRCTDENDLRYEIYGGRGITICSDWDSFENFAKWAAESGYSDELSIDRIDVNGNYSPDNCRWATPHQQSVNRRTTKFYEYNGKCMCIAEWAKEYNIPYKKLHKRLYSGWSIERALTT